MDIPWKDSRFHDRTEKAEVLVQSADHPGSLTDLDKLAMAVQRPWPTPYATAARSMVNCNIGYGSRAVHATDQWLGTTSSCAIALPAMVPLAIATLSARMGVVQSPLANTPATLVRCMKST